MGIFKEVQNVTYLVDKQNIIRNNINSWANAYNRVAFKNMGDKIKILNTIFYPIDIFHIENMIETRIILRNSNPALVSNKERTLDAECKFFEPEDIDPWTLNLNPAPSEFSNKIYTIPVGNSSHLKQCVSCKGNGKNPCISCNSRGTMICQSCHGKGYQGCTACGATAKTMCTYCLGQGRQNVQKTIEKTDGNGANQQSTYYETVLCIYCQGLGSFKCNFCNSGVITCNQCSGSKIITCSTCKGARYNNCEVCIGSGNFLLSLSVNQDFKLLDEVLAFVHPDVKKIFPLFEPEIDLKNPNIKKIHEYENSTKLSVADAMAFLPNTYMTGNEYRDLVAKLIEKELSSVQGKLSKQKLSFYQSDTYVVEIEYLGNKYILISDNTVGTIYAPNSPFTELAAEYIQKSQAEISKKNFGQAMKSAEEAYSISRGTSSEVIAETLMKDIKKMMNHHYIFGFFHGTGTYWVVQLILNLLKGRDFSIENFIKNTVIVAFLFIVLKIFEMRISNFVPDIIIKNDIIRTIFGGIVALIVSLVIYSILNIFYDCIV